MLASYHARLQTPFAVLGIRTVGERVTDIDYLPRGVAVLGPLNATAERACREIERYIDDGGYTPNIVFELDGTAFQREVWKRISTIPSGRTVTYNEIARALRTAPRPVGGACGANRLPIVIACHRVVGASGIGGFMRGAEEGALGIKRWLLRHEGAIIS
jgi:methylated-DNA-[protein]-cysteine S-methyltransferase